MKVFAALIILPEHIYQKIRQHIVIPRHRISHIKKLRKDHEIDRDIFFSRRQDLMPCKLVQKKQFSLAEHHFLAANDIGKLSLTDIKHLDKVMAVRRKMHEPRMCPDRDQLALAEHLGTVHGKILTRGVQILIYLRDSVQDPLFFLCDFS